MSANKAFDNGDCLQVDYCIDQRDGGGNRAQLQRVQGVQDASEREGFRDYRSPYVSINVRLLARSIRDAVWSSDSVWAG
jgi:hypothetical protein